MVIAVSKINNRLRRLDRLRKNPLETLDAVIPLHEHNESRVLEIESRIARQFIPAIMITVICLVLLWIGLNLLNEESTLIDSQRGGLVQQVEARAMEPWLSSGGSRH